jgi:predicted TIM-barrel fold metal-dependent hydrolase
LNLTPDNLRVRRVQEPSDWHLPRHAWDSHVHVFNPTHYPYALSHAYSPVPALASALQAFEISLSANAEPQNVVLVQPSPYGTDNSLIIDMLNDRFMSKKNSQMRGIAVIDPDKLTDEELDNMHQIGIRGIRVNTEATGEQADFATTNMQIMAAAKRVSKYKHWKCQLFISGKNWQRESLLIVPAALRYMELTDLNYRRLKHNPQSPHPSNCRSSGGNERTLRPP